MGHQKGAFGEMTEERGRGGGGVPLGLAEKRGGGGGAAGGFAVAS